MSKIIAIYDSDAIAYRAAAVVDKREIEVKHLKSGRTKIFNNKTEFKDLLKSKNMEFNKEDYEFRDNLISGDLHTAVSIMKNQIKQINSDLFADEVLMCIQGLTNFRDNLPLPSKYKGNRVDILRPTWLRECKTYLYKNYPSYVVNNCECDDGVIFKGYEYLNKGYIPIIVGVDKDAKAYSGLNLYDYTDDNPEVKLIPDFGSLWISNENKVKTVKGEGFMWFCFQIINGDLSDNYKPCELSGVKYGQMSAFNLLKDCNSKKEALELVVNQYKDWYKGNIEYKDWSGKSHLVTYKEILDMYYKCVKMKCTEDDDLNSIDFFKKHGVDL